VIRPAAILLLTLGLTLTTGARTPNDHTALIKRSVRHATPSARNVLSTAHRMVRRGTIVRGSCWHYLDTAFTRAGFPAGRRTKVFHTSRKGPYAPARMLQPGDWLYYINHSYGGVEHSGLFIGWVDRARRQGLILSYPGEHRRKPGRYRVYDLRHVYHITRPGVRDE